MKLSKMIYAPLVVMSQIPTLGMMSLGRNIAYQEFANSVKTTYLVETRQPEAGSLMAPLPLEGSYHIAFLGRSVIIMAYQIEGGQK